MNRSSDLISMSWDLVNIKPPVASSAVVSLAIPWAGASANVPRSSAQIACCVMGTSWTWMLDALHPPAEDHQIHQFHFLPGIDRKSTRLNSSHLGISYA